MRVLAAAGLAAIAMTVYILIENLTAAPFDPGKFILFIATMLVMGLLLLTDWSKP